MAGNVNWDGVGKSIKDGASAAVDVASNAAGAVKDSVYDDRTGSFKKDSSLIAIAAGSVAALFAVFGGFVESAVGALVVGVGAFGLAAYASNKDWSGKEESKLAQNETGNQPVVAKGKTQEQETKLSLNEPSIEVPKTPINKSTTNAPNLFC